MTRTNSKSRSSAGAGAGAGQAGYYPYFTLLFMYLCFTNQFMLAINDVFLLEILMASRGYYDGYR